MASHRFSWLALAVTIAVLLDTRDRCAVSSASSMLTSASGVVRTPLGESVGRMAALRGPTQAAAPG